MITSFSAVPALSPSRPLYLEPQIDPRYGSKIVRICGETGNLLTNSEGRWQKDARHHYSKDQPWNHNSTLVWIEQRGGEPSKLILDGHSWRPVASSNTLPLLHDAYETRWRPGSPSQMVSWSRSQQALYVWDVLSGKVLWRVSVPSADPDFGLLSEGVLSDDGRYVVLATSFTRPQGRMVRDYFVIVDLVEHVVGPQNSWAMDYPTQDAGDVDWVAISPLGNFVVVKYSSTGKPEYARGFHRGGGPVLDTRTLQCSPHVMAVSGLRMIDTREDRFGWLPCMSHADFNVVDGREVLVGGIRDASRSNHCNDDDVKNLGRVIAVDLATGNHQHVSAGIQHTGKLEAADQHTSGRAYLRRGWHLVTYEEQDRLFGGEMVWWKLDGSRQCVRVGQTHTDDSIYRAEAHGVPSPDGEQVMYASNYRKNADPLGPALDDVKSYVISAG